ncbi:MAG: hydantoinase B/oxoprolinase family protein [Pseudomonadota bacterium]
MDELTVQLSWNRLLAIVEEQAQVLMRTAFSTVVREAGDLSAGVFDVQGRMIAQAVTGTPGHVNSMADAVAKFLVRFPLDTLTSGDVLVTNDPWDGTGHLNDFTVVTPVFMRGRCIALFASTSHIADVGGRGFGADANDVFEEGIRIPICYLFRQGSIESVLLELLKANVRDPQVLEGDLYSLTACNDSGATQLLEMMDDFGLEDLERLSEVIITRSAQAMAQEIAALPQGSFVNKMIIDGYDEPILLCARLTVSESQIELDFSGTSQASAKGINVPLSYTQAYASFGVRCVVGNEIPNNAGSLSLINVSAPPGCLVNAESPRAVSARHSVGQMLPDVVLGCLFQAVPERVPAEGASCIWNPVFMSSVGASQEFVINPIFNGGTGARSAKDGLSTTAFPSGVKTTSTEVNETTSPLMIWQKEYTCDSGGKGKYRGGLGQTIRVTHNHNETFVVSKMFDRIRHPARGRGSGEPGQAGRVYVVDPDGMVNDLPAKGRDEVPAGSTLVFQTPGGGGLGDRADRVPELVARDRLNGYVSE